MHTGCYVALVVAYLVAALAYGLLMLETIRAPDGGAHAPPSPPSTPSSAPVVVMPDWGGPVLDWPAGNRTRYTVRYA